MHCGEFVHTMSKQHSLSVTSLKNVVSETPYSVRKRVTNMTSLSRKTRPSGIKHSIYGHIYFRLQDQSSRLAIEIDYDVQIDTVGVFWSVSPVPQRPIGKPCLGAAV